MAQELSSEYSTGELERAATEFVDRKLDAKAIVSSVFPMINDCTAFLDRLRSLAATPGCTVSLNGYLLKVFQENHGLGAACLKFVKLFEH